MCSQGQVKHISPGAIVYDQLNGIYRAIGNNIYQTEEIREVTAVLVLYGLPRDLTASILAHEAMHVFIKLQKSFPFHLPSQIEEGICQVISSKYLEYLNNSNNNKSKYDNNKSIEDKRDYELRDFFKVTIETDPSVVYGDGYRQAIHVVDILSLPIVLEYIQHNSKLPDT